jgi:hypothetical protein
VAAHVSHHEPTNERLQLGAGARLVIGGGVVIAALGLVIALATLPGMQRFLFSYLTAWAYCLSLALGALFAVVVHHASRAGWNVTVRRTTENVAAALPVLCVLSLPLLASILSQKGTLYRWAIPGNSPEQVQTEGKEAVGLAPTAEEGYSRRVEDFKNGPTFEAGIKWKRENVTSWYGNGFFFLRIALYIIAWSGMSIWFRKLSREQDDTGDPALTSRMQAFAPVGLVILGLSITFAAFDLLMSLDPHWYSTMFGVYYIAGCIVSGFAIVIVSLMLLQHAGYLRESVSIDHFHDLGKYLFAFTFFFGYIAFGQYMLLWYSSIPEEVSWYSRHGATTLHPTNWSGVIVVILFGQFAIPFLGLLSRHVKRNRAALFFWAVWVLVFHYIDIYWIVMPEYRGLRPAVVDLGTLLFVGGICVAAVVRNMTQGSLRAMHDPRLPDALAFTNI